MREWTVYSRPDCTLCEQLIVQLAELLGADAVHASVVDISGNAELERKYGQRIPVLLADGEFVCAYHLDEQRVRGYL